jgi:hypothetical protein
VTFNIVAVGAGPDGRFRQAENAGTTVVCGTVFNCHVTWTVTTATTGTLTSTTRGVTGEFNSTAGTLSFADGVRATGLVGCTDPVTWNTVYSVTPTNLAVRP